MQSECSNIIENVQYRMKWEAWGCIMAGIIVGHATGEGTGAINKPGS